MKSGYDQFFIKAKQASAAKPAAAENNFEVKRQFKTRPKKKKRPFPVASFVLFGVIVLSMIIALEKSDQIESYLGKIELGFSTAVAETPIKKDEVNKEVAPEVVSKITQEKVDDSDYLFKLSERKKELDAREESLNKQSEEIAKQKQEIESKLK